MDTDIEAVIQQARKENATHLSLRGRALTALPDCIGDLINLMQLSLADNALTELPSQLGNLANLTHLNLKNNQLKSLPFEITKLENLKMLQLQGNPLPIPAEIVAKWDRPMEILDYYREHFVHEVVPEAAVDRTSLQWILSEHFTEENLRHLCEDISVDYDTLGGTTVEERIRSLIAFHEYHGLGDDFAYLIHALLA